MTFSFTPSTTDLLTDVVCTAPQSAAESSGRVYVAHLAVNDRNVSRSSCGDLTSPPRGTDQGWVRSSAAANASRWEQRGVVVGQPTRVRVWLSDRLSAEAPAVAVPRAQVGAAFWAHDVPVVRQQGVEIDNAVERSGVEFDLFDLSCRRLQAGRAEVSVDLAGPALVSRSGTAVAGSAGGAALGDPPPEAVTTSTGLLSDPPEIVRHAVRGGTGEQGWSCLTVYTPRG